LIEWRRQGSGQVDRFRGKILVAEESGRGRVGPLPVDQVLEEVSEAAYVPVAGNGCDSEAMLNPPLDMRVALELTKAMDLGMVLTQVGDKAA
jgi:hypothetical protein